MNILFLTLLDFNSYNERGIYTDLLREFVKHGHSIYSVSPVERRNKKRTNVIIENNNQILKLRIGNIQKTNLIEKGVSTILVEPQVKAGIQKYFSKIKFDLVLYSTPPITFSNVVKFVKKRDNAKSYLLLKDIFPQNAVDLQMFSQNSLLYRYFRQKEKRLYALSDFIGCMSPTNVQYLLSHNQDIDPAKVEVCPNSIEVRNICLSLNEKMAMRDKYELPREKTIFVYGGNLGKPQGIPFMIECLKNQRNNQQAYFLIAGSGTESYLIEEFIKEEKPDNVKLLPQIPRDEFDLMIASCDVGLIFLDHRFTIPNFPSRLLSYMQAGLPVLACTDPNTDIGKIITEGGFGWRCESNDTAAFDEIVKGSSSADLVLLGKNAWNYLNEKYTAENCFAEIVVQKELETG